MVAGLKIIMAQLNMLVGAIRINTATVLAAAKEACEVHKADMIVFPELTLTGYPPEDLLLRPSLKSRIDKALKDLLAAELDIVMVVGYPHHEGRELYNALAVISSGKIQGRYFKQCLPNYQVFDEYRYFSPGNSPCIINIKGTPVAFTICEDLWEQHPTLQARDAGAKLLINISASPYHISKVSERSQLLRKRSREGNFPILYTNLVGGQDELVFDGSSMVVDMYGECRFLAPAFKSGLFPIQLNLPDSATGQIEIPLHPMSPQGPLEADIYQALVLGVKDYVEKNNFKGVVLGLSGGIDSALTLAVAVDALGSDRVRAVMMPFDYTSELSQQAAAQQAGKLAVNYQVISIVETYHAFMNALQEEFAGLPVDVSEQNIQARCRGVILMAISNKKGLLVLTTGNKSEIAVGYCTLYGDMAGGYDVLKDVSKTMVYRLSNYRNKSYATTPEEIIPQSVIDRPPTAELAPGQVDQDSLPPYDELDKILEMYVEQDLSANDIIARGFAEAVVRKVLRLVDLNEYKRRQSPIGVRLTQRGFGRDRRYPITNAWELGE